MKTIKIFLLITLVLSPAVIRSQNWVQQSSGTVNSLRSVWFIDNLRGWAVGNAATVRFTVNGGALWQAAGGFGTEDLLDVAFLNASTGIITGDNGRIFRTVNGGVSWTQVTSGTSSNIHTLTFGSGGVVYAAGRDGAVLRSTDYGQSWTVQTIGSIRYRGSDADGSNSWIAGENGTILFSNNSGVSYSNQSSGTSANLHTVFMLNSVTGFIGGQNSTLLYTSNGGSSWVFRNSGIAQGVNGISFVNAQTGWVVCNAGAVYRTVNSGVSWGAENSTTTVELNDVFFSDVNHGWAVGAGGVILFRGDNIGIIKLSDIIPSEFNLMQNYPNPFNPLTKIRFSLPRTSQVRVTVYDALGREVTTAVKEQLNPGTYEVDFDGTDYPSGVYFFRLTADGKYIDSRKMMIAK